MGRRIVVGPSVAAAMAREKDAFARRCAREATVAAAQATAQATEQEKRDAAKATRAKRENERLAKERENFAAQHAPRVQRTGLAVWAKEPEPVKAPPKPPKRKPKAEAKGEPVKAPPKAKEPVMVRVLVRTLERQALVRRWYLIRCCAGEDWFGVESQADAFRAAWKRWPLAVDWTCVQATNVRPVPPAKRKAPSTAPEFVCPKCGQKTMSALDLRMALDECGPCRQGASPSAQMAAQLASLGKFI
jgi:hypothetical protein